MNSGNSSKKIPTFYESLSEILKVANYSLNLFKGNSDSVHGYPAAILLATFIEAMGHNFGFKKKRDAETYKILKDREFYNYNYLEDDHFKVIYPTFRCTLSHHAKLNDRYKKNINMHVDEGVQEAIMINEHTISVNLKKLLSDSEALLSERKSEISTSTNHIEIGIPLTANRSSNLKPFHEAVGANSEITLEKGASATEQNQIKF